MSHIQFFNKTSPPNGWDDFVLKNPAGKIYHLTSWHKVIEKTFGHSTRYFGFKRNDMLQTILPITFFKTKLFGRFGVSLPYVNYGGPLLEGENLTQELFNGIFNYIKKINLEFIELRLKEKTRTSFLERSHKVTFYLNLPESVDQLWNSLKAKLRSQIKRPIKEKMYTQRGGIELLNNFYTVFATNMRDLGTPVYAKNFFKNILTTFPQNAFVVIVYSREHRPVAASFLIIYKKIMEIPWASSLRKYNRFSPNMLLYWESMRLAIETGCKVFDFGRCTPGGGPYRFKKQWGGQECPLFWYYILPESGELPELNPTNSKYQLAVRVWSKLPLFLTNLIGPGIIKNIP